MPFELEILSAGLGCAVFKIPCSTVAMEPACSGGKRSRSTLVSTCFVEVELPVVRTLRPPGDLDLHVS